MSNSNKNGGQYGVQVTAGIRVAMRDGVELNVRTPEGKLPPPVYVLHYDLVADTVTCELAAGNAEQQGYNSSRYTVSNRNPAEVSIESSFFYRASHPALDIRVEARCLTKSDATSYTHSSTVDIKVDGQRYFYKDWTTTVPRGGS